jgi:glycerophosphoryl diester phosphodiesterase
MVAAVNAPLPTRAAESNAPALRLLQLDRPLVIGHRGYSALAPENTLPAFRFALTAGVDLVELDYYPSRDGVPVVIHDGTLDRTTDAVKRWGGAKIPVASKTAAELQTLDAGLWFSTNFAGTHLPLLAEALDLIQRGGVTLIERKGGDAANCVQLLRDRQLVNRVVVQSFDWDYLREFHRLAPEQVLGALGPPSKYADGRKVSLEERLLSAEWLDTARDTGARIIVWNDQVTREAVALAHQRGWKVWVYTIDESEAASRLFDLDVDGLISNNPAIVWKSLATRRR